MGDFAESEFAGVDLKDERLNARLRKVVGRMFQSPMRSVQAACRGWSETMGAYRLLGHSAVNEEVLLAPHRECVVERAKGFGCVALIQDTSELDYTTKKHLKGAGAIDGNDRRGFFTHPQFVVSEDGLPLGLLDAGLFAREEDDGQAKDKHRPIEQKESYRWVKGYGKACEFVAEVPGVDVFSISDREGDIFEMFELWQNRRVEGLPVAEWIVRATQDRALLDPVTGKVLADSLFEKAGQGRELGTIEFVVKERKQRKRVNRNSTKTVLRPGREVRQRICAAQITPRVPYRRGHKLSEVSFWVVLAEEIDPPPGADPIRWILLTSAPVETFAQARRIVKLYLARWQIEVFFRVLKTGCRVEELQLKKQQAVFNALVLYMIVAWRILYLVHLGRECPDLPCSVVFEEAEWKAAVAVARKKYGKTKTLQKEEQTREPSLGEMISIVARFGGYLARKSDPPPGAQALWQGIMRLCNYAEAWEAFGRPKV